MLSCCFETLSSGDVLSCAGHGFLVLGGYTVSQPTTSMLYFAELTHVWILRQTVAKCVSQYPSRMQQHWCASPPHVHILWLPDTCTHRRMPSVLGKYRCGTAVHVCSPTLPTRRATTAASMLLGHPCSSVQIAATACLVITRPCAVADSAAAEVVQVVYHGQGTCQLPALPVVMLVSSMVCCEFSVAARDKMLQVSHTVRMCNVCQAAPNLDSLPVDMCMCEQYTSLL
jgi:hypothetical protein